MSGHLINYKELLSYDPITGQFTWKVTRSPTAKAGGRAGTVNNAGYRKIKFGKFSVLEHRLAFYFMENKWPSDKVDHKNRDRADNRWENLRECNNHQNQLNTAPRGKSGFKGVYWQKCGYAVHGHLNEYLCFTKDFDRACEISKEHRLKYGGEFVSL